METGRAKRGASLIKKVKTTNYEITNVIETTSKDIITYMNEDGKVEIKMSEIPIMDTISTGSTISKKTILDAFVKVELESKSELVETQMEEEVETLEEEATQVSFNLDDFKL